MPRLFTGLEIPAAAADRLALYRGGLVGARWIEPSDYHITLRFIGDVSVATANEIADSLDEIVLPAPGIAFDRLDGFGGDKPRAIIARVQPTPALRELQADQERRMRRLGLAAETRKFTPHVTLARLRSISPLAVADYLASRGALDVPGFRAARFVLYSAKDSVGGGPYVVEAAYPLS